MQKQTYSLCRTWRKYVQKTGLQLYKPETKRPEDKKPKKHSLSYRRHFILELIGWQIKLPMLPKYSGSGAGEQLLRDFGKTNGNSSTERKQWPTDIPLLALTISRQSPWCKLDKQKVIQYPHYSEKQRPLQVKTCLSGCFQSLYNKSSKRE